METNKELLENLNQLNFVKDVKTVDNLDYWKQKKEIYRKLEIQGKVEFDEENEEIVICDLSVWSPSKYTNVKIAVDKYWSYYLPQCNINSMNKLCIILKK